MAGGLSCWPGREGGLTWQRQLVGELAYLSVRAASSPFPHRPFLLALRPELGSPPRGRDGLEAKAAWASGIQRQLRECRAVIPHASPAAWLVFRVWALESGFVETAHGEAGKWCVHPC